MFSRVTFEDWQAIITIIAFFLCFLTFAYFAWRALKMKKTERDRMANLPLEEEISNHKKHEQ
jgi:cbb3-type cytochrome oxidase subunit 3